MTHILVIEDDKNLRETISYTLEALGHNVISCADILYAKKNLMKTKFSLIISDYYLPDGSALDITKWLRALESQKQSNPTLMVVMSSDEENLKKENIKSIGIDAVLPKPFNQNKLDKLIKDLLEQEAKTNENDFLCIPLDQFLNAGSAMLDIYVCLGNNKYVKIVNQGDDFSGNRRSSYQDKTESKFYAKTDAIFRLYSLSSNLRGKVHNKDDFLYLLDKFSRFITNTVLLKGCDLELYSKASNHSEFSLSILANDPRLLGPLKNLSLKRENIFIKSLGLSNYTYMVAKDLDIEDPASYLELSFASLLYNLGKLDIEESLLNKNKPLLSLKERLEIESHYIKGEKIIETIDWLPDGTKETAFAADRFLNEKASVNKGIPDSISTLSKILYTTNLFCNYAIDKAESKKMTAIEAIRTMKQNESKTLPRREFKALQNVFNCHEI